MADSAHGTAASMSKMRVSSRAPGGALGLQPKGALHLQPKHELPGIRYNVNSTAQKATDGNRGPPISAVTRGPSLGPPTGPPLLPPSGPDIFAIFGPRVVAASDQSPSACEWDSDGDDGSFIANDPDEWGFLTRRNVDGLDPHTSTISKRGIEVRLGGNNKEPLPKKFKAGIKLVKPETPYMKDLYLVRSTFPKISSLVGPAEDLSKKVAERDPRLPLGLAPSRPRGDEDNSAGGGSREAQSCGDTSEGSILERDSLSGGISDDILSACSAEYIAWSNDEWYNEVGWLVSTSRLLCSSANIPPDRPSRSCQENSCRA